MRFRDLIGQDEAVGRIRANLAADRLPHAYLFHGRVGVGKTTAALALGRRLLCSDPGPLDACERCANCFRSGHFNHPDLFLLPPTPSAPDSQAGEGQRLDWINSVQSEFIRSPIFQLDESRPLEHRIATMRWLKQESSRAASGSGWKIFILKRAGQLNVEAANAILKLLEEPNPGTLLILGVGRPADLPDTIKSRCALVRFRDLPVEEIVRLLLERAGKAGDTVSDTAVRLAARVARGSLTRAASLLDEDVIGLRDDAVTFVTARTGQPEIHERLDPWLRGKDRSRLDLLFDLMLLWQSDLVRVKLGAVDPGEGLANHDRLQDLMAEAPDRSFEEIESSVQAVEEARRAVDGHGYLPLVLPALVESVARRS
ncbi:MAG: DNA polymerase III subunit delta' [bacterium]|nr:MAG: DNA polymerase III subunit delta' [bacterium]